MVKFQGQGGKNENGLRLAPRIPSRYAPRRRDSVRIELGHDPSPSLKVLLAEVHETPEVRIEKVRQIREAMAIGTYKIASTDIAESLIRYYLVRRAD